MITEKHGDVVLACKNRIRLLVQILDDNVAGIGSLDDQDFLYGVLTVLRDVDGDLDVLVDDAARRPMKPV